jgi:hypothetical protein
MNIEHPNFSQEPNQNIKVLSGKKDDLGAYRSGMLKVKELKSSEDHIRPTGDVEIVSVHMQLSGTADGNPANGDFRFTRDWALSPGKACCSCPCGIRRLIQ